MRIEKLNNVLEKVGVVEVLRLRIYHNHWIKGFNQEEKFL